MTATRKPKRVRLTDRYVKSANATDRPVNVYDTKQDGLVLRTYPSGRKVWRIYYRRAGRPRWFTLGPVAGKGVEITVEEARRRAQVEFGRIAADESYDPCDERVELRRAETVAELIDLYKAEKLAKLKSGDQGAFLLDRFARPSLGGLKARAVTRGDVRRLRDSMKKATTCNQVLANVSAMYNWAIRNDVGGVQVNPARGVERHATRARERVLADHEVPVFWDAFEGIGAPAGDALKFLLLTGQRPGEVRHLRWEHLQQDAKGRWWWHLPGEADAVWPGTKNGRAHVVYVSTAARAILDDLDEQREGFVFGRAGRPLGGLDGRLRDACGVLGYNDQDRVTPHDLRRTHGTTVTGLGFTREQMNRIQNHVEGGIADVYDQHHYRDEIEEIQEAVAERLIALLGSGDRAASTVR